MTKTKRPVVDSVRLLPLAALRDVTGGTSSTTSTSSTKSSQSMDQYIRQ